MILRKSVYQIKHFLHCTLIFIFLFFCECRFPKISDGDVDPSLVKKIDLKKRDSTHPNWHDEPIRIFHQHSSFFYGLDESLNLTKTNLVDTSLPNKILSFKKEMGDEFHDKVQR